MVPVALVELAEREFAFLMRHAQEDAMQVLAMAHCESQGKDTTTVARAELSQLARDLGYRREGDVWRRAA
jgi:hypothetical protein